MSLITHSNVLVRHENRYSIGLISLVYLLGLSKKWAFEKKKLPHLFGQHKMNLKVYLMASKIFKLYIGQGTFNII